MRRSLRWAHLASTAVMRARAAVRWLECFMAMGHRTGWSEGSPGILWLYNEPHPCFYERWVEDGRLNIVFDPNIRVPGLQVLWSRR